MTSSETEDAHGVAAIAGNGLSGTTAVIRDTHAAIAGRVFGMVGTPAAPARLMHDGISKGVYAAVAGGLRASSYVAGRTVGVASLLRARETPYVRLTDRPAGNAVVGALNGAWGDAFERWHNPLAVRMSVRVDGRDVGTDAVSLAAAVPDASDDVVVFLHGLCETELAWWRKARELHGSPRSSHGFRLTHEIGATPVYLRYNSGRHISDNGEQLAALLGELTDNWPTEITRLTLIGHSMGGLVARSACCHGLGADQDWVRRASRLVYLGAPHLGAPLEIAATKAGIALRRLPETAPIARALASRSVGIKDLRFGAVVPQDWSDVLDPDAWRDEPDDCAPLLDTAEHYYIGVTLTQDQDHWVARLVGDALVTFPSASGSNKKRSLSLEVDRGRHLGGLNHFDLLNHPRVWEQLRDWLATG